MATVDYHNAYNSLTFNELRTKYERFWNKKNSFSKLVETGKEYTVDVTDNSSANDGIVRIQGLVIFVKSAKAGDKNVKD
jgi:predicted RNA-binding protein with TRAM domain